MTDRKPIAKSVRFEVFKRDSFTCQYCGGKAPDVILVVDHIKPVAEGGDNEIMNLVTSCQPCNAGKGARELDDNSVVERQRRQIEDLEERRSQLEMMLRWRDEVKDLDAQIDRYVAAHIASVAKFQPNQRGMTDVRRWVKKFPLELLLSAIDEAFAKHLVWADSEPTSVSWNKAFNWVERFARSKVRYGDGPEVDQFLYIQGIIRNRLGDRYFSAMSEIKELYDLGYKIEDIQKAAKSLDSHDDFDSWYGTWSSYAKGK